jgi:demethylmenaquinone methyltransferase / 2-methoxy-6-polyprenyl-1,4-benzoquinol methylase
VIIPLQTKSDEQMKAAGAAPQGATDERSAARAVQQMFDEIAPRYDLANHLLSMNVDRLWWWRTARNFAHILNRPDAQILDLCCGTGDMATALHRQMKAPRVLYAADFSHEMLKRGRQKFLSHSIIAIEADALQLPFASSRFDLVTSAFGFRNLANYEHGLREIYRVLRPNGEIGILDFNEPEGLFGKLYGSYFRNVLPKLGTLISGVSGPYSYLPASVKRFPAPAEMLDRMGGAGFKNPTWTPYTFGIAGLFRGKK